MGVAQWNDLSCAATVPDIIVEYDTTAVPALPRAGIWLLALLLLATGVALRRGRAGFSAP